MLRPGYRPPSRLTLEEEDCSTKEDCKEQLKGKPVSMALDGWNNAHNEAVVCVTCHNIWWRYISLRHRGYTGKMSHCRIFDRRRKHGYIIVYSLFNSRTESFVTDNAANVAKMRRQLQEREDYDITRHLWLFCASVQFLSQGCWGQRCVGQYCTYR